MTEPTDPAAEESPSDPLASSPSFLPEEQAREIFASDIAPFLFGHGEPQDNPLAVIVIAQPGAGKTALTQQLRGEVRGDAVVVEVDGLKPFHPDLVALVSQVGDVAADELVQADARRWAGMAVDHLLGRRVNVLIEQFPRSRDMLADTVGQLSEAGYEVRAAVVTTPLPLSMQGVLLRFWEGHEHTGGRDVPLDKQRERFDQIPQIVDWLLADPQIAEVTLYRRTGAVVFSTGRAGADDSVDADAARQALSQERQRPWSVRESEEFLDLQARLRGRMSPEWGPRIDAADQAAAGLIAPMPWGAAGGPPGAVKSDAAATTWPQDPPTSSQGFRPEPGPTQAGNGPHL